MKAKMVAVAGAAPGSVAEVVAIAAAEVDAVVEDVAAAGAAVETSGTERGVVKVVFTVHSVPIFSHRSSRICTDKRKRYRNGVCEMQVKGGFGFSVPICDDLWENRSSRAVEVLKLTEEHACPLVFAALTLNEVVVLTRPTCVTPQPPISSVSFRVIRGR